jgi:hypothetical protein
MSAVRHWPLSSADVFGSVGGVGGVGGVELMLSPAPGRVSGLPSVVSGLIVVQLFPVAGEHAGRPRGQA